jgi:hypothetical protein
MGAIHADIGSSVRGTGRIRSTVHRTVVGDPNGSELR